MATRSSRGTIRLILPSLNRYRPVAGEFDHPFHSFGLSCDYRLGQVLAEPIRIDHIAQVFRNVDTQGVRRGFQLGPRELEFTFALAIVIEENRRR